MKKLRLLLTVFFITLLTMIVTIPQAASASTGCAIEMDQYSKKLAVGKKAALHVLVRGYPITGSDIKWRSSNKKVAVVSSKGVVTAKKNGTAKISATWRGVKVTCKVKVISKTTLDRKTYSGKVGGSIKLKATVNGAKKKVTWKSSNKKIATVSSTGVVKFKKPGQVTITATANKVKATCKIRIS